MPEPVLCKICQKRRARRFCPAVSGDICSICCGTEREVSLTCPLSCEYLQEAHKREKLPQLRNSEILAILVFLHRIGQQNQNGKPRGRMFLDLLRHMTPERERVPEQTSSIII